MTYQVISAVFRIYEIIVIIRVVFSWIQMDHHNPLVQLIYKLTEPLLEPIRNILPTGNIGIDFSPLLLLFALQLVQQILLRLLFSF